MTKRLSKQEKKDLFIIDVINKMFEIAGYDVTYDDIKDRKDNWYSQWTMTMKQNNEWQEWGINEIRKRFRYNKVWAKKEMAMISLQWGLKFSDFLKS
jgi:hypothetical protein